MEICSRGHRLLNDVAKRNTNIGGMGPFNAYSALIHVHVHMSFQLPSM